MSWFADWSKRRHVRGMRTGWHCAGGGIWRDENMEL